MVLTSRFSFSIISFVSATSNIFDHIVSSVLPNVVSSLLQSPLSQLNPVHLVEDLFLLTFDDHADVSPQLLQLLYDHTEILCVRFISTIIIILKIPLHDFWEMSSILLMIIAR